MMRAYRPWAALGGAALLLAACGDALEQEQRVEQERRIEQFLVQNGRPFVKEQGLYRAVLSPGFGHPIRPGDTVEFIYAGYTLHGLLFDTNDSILALARGLDIRFRQLGPIQIVAGDGALIEGLNRGIPLSREGELSTIAFPADLGFGGDRFGPVPPWSPLAYDVWITSVSNPRIRLEREVLRGILRASPAGYRLDTLRGFWHTPVTGGLVRPSLNDTIYGWFRGQTPDGTIFHELPEGSQPLVLSAGLMPEGLAHAFTLLSPHEKAQVVLPSSLAYGPEGQGIVGPYTPVRYSIRLDSIIN